jgi:hypothetical protein
MRCLISKILPRSTATKVAWSFTEKGSSSN